MSKKNNVKVGLIEGNTISENEKANVELVEEVTKKGSIVEKIVKPALLISKVDNPETIKYGDSFIRLSGRAQEKVADHTKLGELPKGVLLKQL